MTDTITLVPVHLDALFLSSDQLAIEACADFSSLPFYNSANREDVNPDIAYISESVLSQPFHNYNLNLKKGLHLHWALPDALARGGSGGKDTDYPAVPNRWLVTRLRNGVIDKQWVVESDYLHPAGSANVYGSIVFPFDTDDGQAYRYLGRKLDYDGWSEDASAERLSPLTAIGYGEPTFSAFYPDCHSVFGCYDNEITEQSQLTDLSYQLIGWYSDVSQDPLAQFITATAAESVADVATLLKQQFGWTLTIDEDSRPATMVCYADLTFSPDEDIINDRKDQPTVVSIGNTGTEALSAYLANRLHPQNLT